MELLERKQGLWWVAMRSIRPQRRVRHVAGPGHSFCRYQLALDGAVGQPMFVQHFSRGCHNRGVFGFDFQLMLSEFLVVTKTPRCSYINQFMVNWMHPSVGFWEPRADCATWAGCRIAWIPAFGDSMNLLLMALNLALLDFYAFTLMTW